MHHIDGPTPPSQPDAANAGPWYKELTRYHWFVLIVSVLGWMFDCLDQQLFNLARGPAISELMGPEHVQWYGGVATMIFMIGWASGGIVFGVMGDRVGRAKTMVLTILVYSMCTGLSAFSVGFWDFAFYRFLTGLGVGGEFAVGIALVAEVMPERARTPALGWLQACSAIGNVTAAFIAMGLSSLEARIELGAAQPWRLMFVVGAIPALLALLIRRRLKEPERWQQLRDDPVASKKLGSFTELLSHPTWRRNALFGLVLATSGVVGLWGIGFFGFDLVRSVFNEKFRNEAKSDKAIANDRNFVLLLLADADHKETVGEGEAAITKSRIDFAKAKVKADQLLDSPSAAVYGAILALVKDNKPLAKDAVVQKAKSIAEEKAKKATGKVSADESPAFRQLVDSAVPTGGFAEIYTTINERSQKIASDLTFWAAIYGLLFNIGAFLGIYAFARITQYTGRKPAFFVTFLLALGTTAYTFWNLSQFSDIFWMVPAMGFAQIALFGGYAIYFPELFPTRLRSTGISFCYNVGRYIASAGPLILGALASNVFGEYGQVMSWRYAGVTMCSFFLLGLVALPFLPETKGKPLPE